MEFLTGSHTSPRQQKSLGKHKRRKQIPPHWAQVEEGKRSPDAEPEGEGLGKCSWEGSTETDRRKAKGLTISFPILHLECTSVMLGFQQFIIRTILTNTVASSRGLKPSKHCSGPASGGWTSSDKPGDSRELWKLRTSSSSQSPFSEDTYTTHPGARL